MKRFLFSAMLIHCAATTLLRAAEGPFKFNDPQPQLYELTARASEIDSRAKEHPEIDFVFAKQGKPSDTERAMVDTRVAPQGKLVIWLMGYSRPLFERVSSYGLHPVQVHYANGWFGKFGNAAPPTDDKFLGKIRLEAATGEDYSEAVNIPKPDGMAERAFQFVKWLAKENPQGRWEMFLTDDRQGLRWDRVIMAGSSHGSTTSARFAIHQRVDRVVMFCGPRDQYETWQALPSATPANRYFGFSHVLDGGWSGDHYCRSWELLGLNRFGPIVNVDKAKPPFGNTRRLITDADVKNDDRRAHSSVVPGGAAVKDASGKYIHEDVWRYLFTHPVEEVGEPTALDPDCLKDQRAQLPKQPAVQSISKNEPTDAAESAAKKAAEDRAVDEQYQKWKAALTPERQAWETVLEQNLGTFYLPIHKREKVRGVSNAWDFVSDDPQLPRVLLIGDSVSRGYTQAVRKALAGKANVHRAPENCGPTANGLKKLDVWLGQGKWDVIHFNFGIHDRATKPADYEQRLKAIVERLQKTGARLIWASTTPIPPDTKDGPAAAAAIEEKNRIAAEVMKKQGAAVDDLYTFITPHLAQVQNPRDVHFNAEGYEMLGRQAAASIEKALK